jgi:hypothetical protein
VRKREGWLVVEEGLRRKLRLRLADTRAELLCWSTAVSEDGDALVLVALVAPLEGAMLSVLWCARSRSQVASIT